ncbi:protocadherin Fat 4-like isoform X2 [Microplitis mediator]|uniref:protocadherin Fat 4-like isoform X2 n=1 Tax=Microplitis mediator TaxID=375433 RepID=UPI0025560A84|nr:protocadherin Fat 4-like isoform X2 [Microplitis mediator]
MIIKTLDMYTSLFSVYFIQFIIITGECGWNNPPFGEPDPLDPAVHHKTYNPSNKRINIDLDEEVPYDVCIAVLTNYDTDEPEPCISSFDQGNNYGLGAELRNHDGQWKVFITKKQDFEIPSMRSYLFWIVKGLDSYEIALYIDNIDDNAPVIQPLERSCATKENYKGKSNCTFSISDADGWIDGVVTTLLSSPNEGTESFSFDSERISGYEMKLSVVIKTPLDFERISMYMLLINATDQSHNEGTLSSIFGVIDMPDERPKWSRLTASETVKEKSTNEFSVVAVDGDLQINAEINYKIQSLDKDTEDYFIVDKSTGVIKINPIDRDILKKDVFKFNITAYEKNDTFSSITATIIVIVEDINDHSPEIRPEILSVDIKEETYMSLDFGQSIVIEDPDLAEKAQYSVHMIDNSSYNWHSAFLIVPNSGYQSSNFTISVINASLLDYEDENWRNIQIEIQAIEVANQSHIGKRTVSINLIDVNDEIPTFTNNTLIVSLPEDVEKDHYICTMLATDRDFGDSVKHSLVGHSGLKINEETGKIMTAIDGALDYEAIPTIVLQITATDLANHMAYGTLILHVIDINDVPPTLYLPKQIPSLEEESNNMKIDTVIQAIDPDSDAKLVFSIDWDSTSAFKSSIIVNQSYYRGHLDIFTNYSKEHTGYAEGVLKTSGRIDYEKFDVMFVTIVVTDLHTVHNDKSINASLTLKIIDINDNAPVFKNVETMSVIENQLHGQFIGTIAATDDDGQLYNQISYSIEPINNTESNLIKINNKTGVIQVDKDKAIDAEKYENLYYRVTASDGDNFAVLQIDIYVIDMNDEIPYLLYDQFESTVHIPEKSPSGKEILTIFARDNDRSYPYNNVSYLMNTNYSVSLQYFKLGRFDGLIQINLADGHVLDRDFGLQTHILNIKLRDNYLHDSITNTNPIDTVITVILDDINDQIPKLPDLKIPMVNVSEITKENTLLFEFEAADYDDPETNNTKVIFTLQNMSQVHGDENYAEKCEAPFKLTTENFTLARISTNRALYDCYGLWALQIHAQDFGTDPGPLSDTKIYYIQITDYNYNAPVIHFPILEKKIVLSQNQTLNAQLKTYDKQPLHDFEAFDGDSGASGTVVFTISSDSRDHELFNIIGTKKNSAQLQLKSLPNITSNDTYNIIITATDGGNPSKNVSQQLSIIFVSTPGPKFNQRDWSIWIEENLLILNTPVVLPEAHDNIIENDSNIVRIYYFVDDTVGDYEFFNLDKETRNLTLAKKLDRETQEMMSIIVIATTDSDSPPRYPSKEATLNITIVVLDENDNAPTFESDFYSGGFTMEDIMDKIILTVKATDADINETLTYSIIDTSMNVSDVSITGVSEPFSLNSDSGELILKFMPQSTMTGFFTFRIVVYDAAHHNDTALLQIYIVSIDNRVAFTFKNNASYITEKRMLIIRSFTNIFKYFCNIDEIKNSIAENGHALDNLTTLTTHFIDIDDHLPIDSNIIVSTSSDLQTITNLKAILQTEAVYLIDVPTGSSLIVHDLQQTVQWILISLTIFFFSCNIALLFFYFVRTQSLTKRLEKMATEWKFGSQQESLDRIGIMPMTNQFALTGSNPIWKASANKSVKTTNDNISEKSENSDFIGIDDEPNFGYKCDTFIFDQNMTVKKRVSPIVAEMPKLILDNPFPKDKYLENDKSC